MRWFESCRGERMKAKRAVRACCAIGVLALMSGAVISSPNSLLAEGPSPAPATAASSEGPSPAPATAASSEGLPADVQAELSSLPVGYVIVPCTAATPGLAWMADFTLDRLGGPSPELPSSFRRVLR